MHVRHLSLTNFRLYARLELDLPTGLSIIQGDNAQGKTSLLEALHFLATAHSMHSNIDRHVFRWGAEEESPYPFVMLKADVKRRDGPHLIELAMQKGDGTRLKKEIKIDRASKRGADLVGQLAVVLFVPGDVELSSGPPSARRDFLDAALTQVDADYVRHLDKFNKALTQRNALLRQAQERRIDPDELAVWDDQLVPNGVQVALRRRDLVTQLAQLAVPIHRELSNNLEYLQLVYQPNFDPDAPPAANAPVQAGLSFAQSLDHYDADDLAKAYRAALKARAAEEMARSVTLVGPHRDELRFKANGMDIGEFGSRGQQRSAVLSLKLAQVAWMRERLDDEPVLLLDEVLAELDPNRRRCLLNRIGSSHQTIITTTDINRFDAAFVQSATLFNVHSGIVHN
ncbi:MAG: DNA replication/repair protein RecF [Anaerolineae bacterium]|nr:DNA replication/repair protein RecF [Anaerolineae bacterium]